MIAFRNTNYFADSMNKSICFENEKQLRQFVCELWDNKIAEDDLFFSEEKWTDKRNGWNTKYLLVKKINEVDYGEEGMVIGYVAEDPTNFYAKMDSAGGIHCSDGCGFQPDKNFCGTCSCSDCTQCESWRKEER